MNPNRVVCRHCQRVFKARPAPGGNGTAFFPARHHYQGRVCEGCYADTDLLPKPSRTPITGPHAAKDS